MLGTSSTSISAALPTRTIPFKSYPSTSGRGAVKFYAYANTHSQGFTRRSGAAYERILRYPDGLERRIRYPAPLEDLSGDSGGGDDWETLNAYKAYSSNSTGAKNTRHSPTTVPNVDEDKTTSDNVIPDSPLALLRQLTSPRALEAQEREWEEIKASYDILSGCPWPAPKPLYVLATFDSANSNERPSSMMHTLRTQIPRQDLENELTKILGNRKGASSEPLIKCNELVDGVIAFEDDGDAERYGEMLEDSMKQRRIDVQVARFDSHELWRNVVEVKGVVVFVKRGSTVFPPHKLGASLRERGRPGNIGDDPWA